MLSLLSTGISMLGAVNLGEMEKMGWGWGDPSFGGFFFADSNCLMEALMNVVSLIVFAVKSLHFLVYP